ncbi:hypothetical protein BC829DRAFT_443599 [Chytridium lagenaria]|nr:hypothetical protein BC829DRAFT_443599 [Chytridium lagenaria]
MVYGKDRNDLGVHASNTCDSVSCADDPDTSADVNVDADGPIQPTRQHTPEYDQRAHIGNIGPLGTPVMVREPPRDTRRAVCVFPVADRPPRTPRMSLDCDGRWIVESSTGSLPTCDATSPRASNLISVDSTPIPMFPSLALEADNSTSFLQ